MEKVFEDNSNTAMALLRGADLRELLFYVQSILLEYRNTLNLPSNVSFGLELEYENLNKSLVDKYFDQEVTSWELGSDGTVSSGGEIRSRVLYDDERTWRELQLVCNFLKRKKATTLNKAGGHIHVGSQALGSAIESWITFFKFYCAYEHVLFRFFYGDKINARDSQLKYAPPCRQKVKRMLLMVEDGESLTKAFNNCNEKYSAVNFGHVSCYKLDSYSDYNTIEFRGPNASINEVIWQNNVNVVTKMLLAAKKGKIDTDYLDYKLKCDYIACNDGNPLPASYNEIFLQDALEFVDSAFEANIDKIYFLRQYLKDFSNNYKVKTPTTAKVFYK